MGGLTIYSDLKNIEIVRENSISNGGGKIKAEVNLLKFINSNDFSQDLRIYDGDAIIVNKNLTPIPEQISKAIKSNINPKFIEIVIAGRVEAPGVFKISKSSTMLDALQLSGGTKFLKGPITFLRYNNDGTLDKENLLSIDLQRGVS